jgi:hypothetical protein
MDQPYRSKIDQMLDNNPTKARVENGIEFYPEKSYARYVRFILPDGTQRSLNYSYLVTCEYCPDAGRIVMEFTTHVVTLTGEFLESLHINILVHLPKVIGCTDARYNDLSEAKAVVNDIVIQETKK